LPAGEVRRARLLLMLAEGMSYQTIQAELPCDATFIVVGSSAFCRTVCPVVRASPGTRSEKRTPKMEAKILEWTRAASRRFDALEPRSWPSILAFNHMMVASLKRARLQPNGSSAT